MRTQDFLIGEEAGLAGRPMPETPGMSSASAAERHWRIVTGYKAGKRMRKHGTCWCEERAIEPEYLWCPKHHPRSNRRLFTKTKNGVILP